MFKIPILYRCPYCPADDGAVWLDSLACVEARREDYDPRYLDQDRIEDGQPFVRFGDGRDHLPCRHALRLEAEIDWKLLWCAWEDHPTDAERETRTWKLTVNWEAACFAELNPFHTGVWMRDYGKIRSKAPACLPRSAHRLDALAGKWAVEDDWVYSFESIYTL